MLTQLPLPIVVALFAAAAVAVWSAGSRLSVYVSTLADRLHLSQGLAGMLFLGGITSLPEIATAGSAALTGSPDLAVSNLLGTASINIMLLVIADVVLARAALESVVASPGSLLQGLLGMLLMTAVAALALVGDREMFGTGLGFGTTGLLAGCVGALWLASRYERSPGWTVADDRAGEPEGEQASEVPAQAKAGRRSTRGLALRTGVAAAVILVAGFVLSQSADGIAEQTGFSAGLIGLVLVGFATSLPELSSILTAVRIGRIDLAVGDVLGTNLVNIAVLFVVDAAYREGLAFEEPSLFAGLAALLAACVIGVFLVGVLVRREAVFLRAGYTSWIAMAVYGGGLALLWSVLRAEGG